MAQKINPIALRLQYTNRYFDNIWYSQIYYDKLITKDLFIQKYINSFLKLCKLPYGRFSIQHTPKKTRLYTFFCYPKTRENLRSSIYGFYNPFIFYRKKYFKNKKTKGFYQNNSLQHSKNIAIKLGKTGYKNSNQIFENTRNSKNYSFIEKNVATNKNKFSYIKNKFLYNKNFWLYQTKSYTNYKINHKYTPLQHYKNREKHSLNVATKYKQFGRPNQFSFFNFFLKTKEKIIPNIYKKKKQSVVELQNCAGRVSVSLNTLQNQYKINDFICRFVCNLISRNTFKCSTGIKKNIHFINVATKHKKNSKESNIFQMEKSVQNTQTGTQKASISGTLRFLNGGEYTSNFRENLYKNLQLYNLNLKNLLKYICIRQYSNSFQNKNMDYISNSVHKTIPIKKSIQNNSRFFENLENIDILYNSGIDSNQLFVYNCNKIIKSNICSISDKWKFIKIENKYKYKNYIQRHLAHIYNCNCEFFPFKVENDWQSAGFLADEIVYFLEKRIAFRDIKNRLLNKIAKNSLLSGIRITCSGRVGGKSKKARRTKTECVKFGQTSLHVFSNKIDFACRTAQTRFGSIGVKVWISYN